MLEVRGLRVEYGHVQALRGVDLQARPREITAIIGSNGAGKTSTLMAISGLAPVTGGEILLEGQTHHAHASTPGDCARDQPDPRGPPAVRRSDRRGQLASRRLHSIAPESGASARAHGARDGPLSDPAQATPAARGHAVGRRAADARHRARPHVRAQAAAHGRTVDGARRRSWSWRSPAPSARCAMRA